MASSCILLLKIYIMFLVVIQTRVRSLADGVSSLSNSQEWRLRLQNLRAAALNETISSVPTMGDLFEISLASNAEANDENCCEESTVSSTILFPFSFPSSTFVPDPKCLGMKVDMVRNITYCTDVFGNEYVQWSPEKTTPIPDPINNNNDDSIQIDSRLDLDVNTEFLLSNTKLVLASYCPNSVYCPIKNATDSSPNSCCIQCDCSDSCVDSGTCCLQKIDSPSNSEVKANGLVQKCVQTFIGDTVQSTFTEIKSTHTYMLVHSCLDNGGIVDDVIRKCLRPRRTKFDEIVPFYSSYTRRNYRNVYCAKCNNDLSTGIYWTTYMTCPAESSTLPFNRRMLNDLQPKTIRRNGCLLYWEHTNTDIKYCVHKESVISTCDMEDLGSFCSKYYAPVRGRRGIYRNLFCLFCNEEGTDITCDRQRGDRMFVMKIPASEFQQQQNDLTESILANDGLVQQNCSTGWSFNAVLNTCIRKDCAVSEMKVGDKCISILETASGIRLDYRITIVFPPATAVQRDAILPSIRSLFSFPDDTCGERIIAIADDKNGVSVQTQIIQSVETIKDIRATYRSVRDQIQQINLRASEQETNVKVDITKQQLAPISEKSLSLGVFSDNANYSWECNGAIAMSDLQFCETILLHNVTFYLDRSIRSGEVDFFPGEYVAYSASEEVDTGASNEERGNVSVCYDVYVSRVLEAQRKQSTASTVPNTNDHDQSGRSSASCRYSLLGVTFIVITALFLKKCFHSW